MAYQVKIVRLLGNQDVIAKVETRTVAGRVSYRLSEVFGVMIVPEEQDSNLVQPGSPARQKLRVELYPYYALYMNDKKYIELDQFHVLFLAEPKAGILDFYNRKTSGLILPDNGGAVQVSNDVEEAPAETPEETSPTQLVDEPVTEVE